MLVLCPSGPLARACLSFFCLLKQLLAHFFTGDWREALLEWEIAFKKKCSQPLLPLFSSHSNCCSFFTFFFHCSLRPQTIDNPNTHTVHIHTHTPFVPKKKTYLFHFFANAYLYKYPLHPPLFEPHTSALLSKGPVPFQPNKQPFTPYPSPFTLHTHTPLHFLTTTTYTYHNEDRHLSYRCPFLGLGCHCRHAR